MAQDIVVPDIGDFDKVEIIEVLVSPGDSVNKDDPLLTLESDKASMEIPSPSAGTIKSLTVSVGEKVGQGDVIGTIEGEAQAEAGEQTDEPAEDSKESAEADSESDEPAKKEPSQEPGQDDKGSDEAADRGAPRTPPVSFDASRILPDKTAHASPSVRRFARELGVQLDGVNGTGRKGRITREDVQGHVKSIMQSGQPVASGGGNGLDLLPWPTVDFSKFGPIESVDLSRIQKLSGRNLARNWAMIPHVTQHDQADITEMEAFRKSMSEQAKAEGYKLTPLAFLIKASVAALKKFPQFNASLDGDQLVLKQYFHIGVAVDTPDGLVVPVIRDCDQKSLSQLATEVVEASIKARDRKLSPADMSGGCFSISSLGGIGGTGFTPIINAPEVAILGVSRSQQQAVWTDSQFVPRLMLPLSLSYDHRVIDGAAAARFTSYLGQMLGDIRQLLL